VAEVGGRDAVFAETHVAGAVGVEPHEPDGGPVPVEGYDNSALGVDLGEAGHDIAEAVHDDLPVAVVPAGGEAGVEPAVGGVADERQLSAVQALDERRGADDDDGAVVGKGDGRHPAGEVGVGHAVAAAEGRVEVAGGEQDAAFQGFRADKGTGAVRLELHEGASSTGGCTELRSEGRCSTGGTPSGVHGTGLEKVVVQPAGTTLAPDTETTIKASTDLAFEVSVKNTGDNQEVRIEVTLTIPKGTTPIVKKQTIDILDIGETKTVTFRDFPDPPFGEKTSVQVSVTPVQGEQNKANNSAEYPVIFSLE